MSDAVDYSSWDIEQLKDYFRALSSEGNRAYEREITELVKQGGEKIAKFAKKLLEIIEKSEDESIKYAAFYAFVLECRYLYKEENARKIREIFESKQFEKMKSYLHLELEWINRYGTVTRDHIEKAREDKKKNSEHAGVIYLSGSIVATFYEKNSDELNNDKKREDITGAIADVQAAIDCENGKYTKFYHGLSRLYYLDGKFNVAKEKIEFAIRSEPLDERSTQENLRRYYSHQTKILAALTVEQAKTEIDAKIKDIETKLKKESETITADLKKENHKNMEFITIFAAIITLIIGSLQLISSQPKLDDAIKLMLVLLGVLLSAFAGFRIIFHEHKEDKNILFACGVIMISGLLGVILIWLFL